MICSELVNTILHTIVAEPVNVKSEQLDTAMVDVHTRPGGTPIKQCTHTIFIWYNQLNCKQESLHSAVDH